MSKSQEPYKPEESQDNKQNNLENLLKTPSSVSPSLTVLPSKFVSTELDCTITDKKKYEHMYFLTDYPKILFCRILKIPDNQMRSIAKKDIGINIETDRSKDDILIDILQALEDMRQHLFIPVLITRKAFKDFPAHLDFDTLANEDAAEAAIGLFAIKGIIVYKQFINKYSKQITDSLQAKEGIIALYKDNSPAAKEGRILYRKTQKLETENNSLLKEKTNTENKEEISCLKRKLKSIETEIKNKEKKLNKTRQEADLKNIEIEKLKEALSTERHKTYKLHSQLENITNLYNSLNNGEEEKQPINQENLGIITIFDEVGFLVLPESRPVFLTQDFLLENKLLHGDTVKIKLWNPLKVSLESSCRYEFKNYIEIRDNRYKIDDGDRLIDLGSINSKFLPKEVMAKAIAVPDSEFGLVLEYLDEPSKTIKLPTKSKDSPKVCVVGGVKESIYRKVTGANNLFWIPANTNNEDVIYAKARKADAIYLIIKYLSHSTYYTAIEVAKKLELPCFHLTSTGQGEFKRKYNEFKNKGF